MKKSSKEDFKQGDLFASLLSELDTEDTSLFLKNYQEQQDVIDKPIDYVSRKAIELRPLDFLRFFPEFQNLSNEELKQVKVLDANPTLETYLKRETNSLTRILETTLNHLRDTTFHIEVQTDYDDTIDERILVYSVLIKRKTKKPKVKTLLINLDPNPKCQLLGKRDFGSLKIEYEVLNLWEQSYQEVKRHHLTGLLPFTPYLKSAGKVEILDASEIIKAEISDSHEQAEMLFLLAILAGRKYNTAGFQLLSPTTLMNIESLRDDPTAKQLIELLFPDKLGAARAEGKAEGKKEATENLIRRFGTLSDEQIKQLKKETETG